MLKKLLDQIYYRKRGLILKVGKVIKVSGPLVVAEGMEDANVYDVVKFLIISSLEKL